MNDDDCIASDMLLCSGSSWRRLLMSAISFFRLRFPIVGDTNIFSSHAAARVIQCFSSITEWAGVLLSFFLKSNGPPRYVLLSARLILSLNLPYFLRFGLERGDRRTRRPHSKSFPESFHSNSLHSGHQWLLLSVFESSDGWRWRNSQKYTPLSAVSWLLSRFTWTTYHLACSVPAGVYYISYLWIALA